MNIKRSMILIGLLILLVAGMLMVNHMQNINQQDAVQNLVMQKAAISFEADCKNLNMLYLSYEDEYKVVMEDAELLWLPLASSPASRPVVQYTIVRVNDAVSVDNQIWLNVTVPVYDTPMNLKGWVPEAKTASVTDENRKLIASGLIVKAGAMAFETDDFANVAKTVPTPLPCDQVASTEDRQQGYLKLNLPGGNIIWVKESDVTFPDLEK